MARVQIAQMVQDFRDALGWPYVSPGTNDEKGIDCSGMFVRAFKRQGATIYHGSNTIWREDLSEKGRILTQNQLKVGMAVFKNRAWTDNDSKHRWYNKDADGNMYHIGLVVSVNPVKIIHASTNGMQVREDPYTKAWTHWGKLKAVDYNSANEEVIPMTTKYVYSENGGDVNLREEKSTRSARITAVPFGAEVQKLSDEGEWSRVMYDRYTGYMMTKFLRDKPVSSTTPVTGSTTNIDGTAKEKLKALLAEMSKLIDAL